MAYDLIFAYDKSYDDLHPNVLGLLLCSHHVFASEYKV